MFRKVVVVLVLTCGLSSAISAQTPQSSSAAVRQAIRTSITPSSSKSVNVKVTATRDARRSSPARAPQAKKSFWKTPWPYVIIVGVGAGVYAIAKSGGAGGY